MGIRPTDTDREPNPKECKVLKTIPPAIVADWVDPAGLARDPYPTYARLRAEAPVAWVPRLNRYLVTTFDECFHIELDQELFSSHEAAERSTMVRAMGRPMLRKDDPEHKRDRDASAKSLRPITIKRVWTEQFAATADRYIARLKEAGPGANLVTEFAIPYAADNLSLVVGLHGVPAEQMRDWSHTLIAGISNVLDDPDVWEQSRRVVEEIDAAIDENILRVRREPDASMLSAMINAEAPLPDEAIRANVRLTISGGMNEPSHAIASSVWALLSHPDQLAEVLDGTWSWMDVFEEAVRWQSPVGMYPRTVTRDTQVGDVPIPAGATIGIVVASANRDERRFERGEEFDLRRDRVTNLAFGNGTHICAGNWVARAQVANVALPRLFEELPGLRLVDPDLVQYSGWVFRGSTSLPVTWDA